MKDDVFHRLMVLQRTLRHPRCPWYARMVIVTTLVLAVSPIDLIPDFIPVLGQLDDLLFIPVGIALAWKLIPEEVKNEVSASLENTDPAIMQRYRKIGLVVIGLWWVVILGVLVSLGIRLFFHR